MHLVGAGWLNDFSSNFATGITGIVGTLFGAFAGAYLQHHFQRQGRILLHANNWRSSTSAADPSGGTLHIAPNRGFGVKFQFSIEAFNERALATGIRGLRVRYLKADGKRAYEVTDLFGDDGAVHVLNLPPGQWVHMSLRGVVKDYSTSELDACRRAELVYLDPSGKEKSLLLIQLRASGLYHD
jgi:hypothetical protein